MKTLLFLLISTVSYSQAIYKMNMSVREVPFSGVTECDNNLDVIWGIKDDTICFLFKQKIRCYYPLSKSTKARIGKLEILNTYKSRYDKRGDRYYILQDNLNEVYLVRILHVDSIVIFIINVEQGIPNYVLTFATDQCK